MKRILYFALMFVIMAAASAFAGGVNRNGGADSRGLAMGGAQIADPDGSSPFYYNPAGLAKEKGGYVFLGFDAMSPKFRYEIPELFGALSEESRNGVVHFLPVAGVVYSSGRFSGGVAVNTSFGLGAKFKGDTHLGFAQTENFIALTDISPAVAIAVTDKLSLGAQLNIGYGAMENKAPFQIGGETAGMSENKADGWGVGMTVGALWQFSEKFAWGMSYRSRTKVDMNGESKFTTAIPGLTSDKFATGFSFPAKLGTGIAFSVCENCTWACDVSWYDYNHVESLSFEYDNLPAVKQDLNWEDCFSVNLGMEHFMTESLCVRAGAGYASKAAPDETVSPLTPDVSGVNIACGAGYELGGYRFDAAYSRAWGIRSVGVSSGRIAPGEYEAEIATFSLTVGKEF